MKHPARDLSALVTGSVVNGVCAYAAVSLGTRTFGAAAFAPVSVLWTFWAVASAVLTFPIQHWIIRQLQVDGHDGAVRAALPKLAILSLLVSVTVGVIAFAARRVLFGDVGLVWPTLVALVSLGTAVMGWTYGRLAGRGRFTAVGTALALENVIRLLAAVAVVIWNGSLVMFGATLVAGPVVTLLWASVFRFDTQKTGSVRVLSFVGGLGGGVLIAQLVLNSGPALLAGLGGRESDVTGLFVALALIRGPYLVALGVATRFTAPLADLVTSRRHADLRRIVVRTMAAIGAMVGVSALVGFYGGPWLIDLLFGEGVAPSPAAVAGVTIGGVLALGTLLLTMIMIARAAPHAVLRAWLLAVLVAAFPLVIGGWPVLMRVVVAFVVAEAVALGALATSQFGPAVRPDPLN